MTADLPLHNGSVPQWLAKRMAKLGLAITEAILIDFVKSELLRRLSDPAVEKVKLGNTDKQQAIRKLHELRVNAEKNFTPNNYFDELIEKERKLPKQKSKGVQLRLF